MTVTVGDAILRRRYAEAQKEAEIATLLARVARIAVYGPEGVSGHFKAACRLARDAGATIEQINYYSGLHAEDWA